MKDTKQGHKVEKNGTTKKHNKNQQEMAVSHITVRSAKWIPVAVHLTSCIADQCN